jgi:DNA-binding transcriptional LysR family regulator
MELRDLAYFVAVADESSFTKAAAALGVAQPSLSQQIKKFETELGIELFSRTKRSVRLTSAGRAVLTEARSLLSQADVTRQVARLAASGRLGELSVGFIEAAVFAVLPRVISAFRASYPNVTVSLRELTTVEQVAALRNMTLDVGILRTPILGDDIETELLMKEHVVVVLPATHELAKGASVRLASLRRENFIFHEGSRARRLRDEIVGLSRAAGFIPRIVQEAGEFHTICGLVAAGLGVSCVPASAQAINIDGVVYRRLTHPEVEIDYRAGWLRQGRSPTVLAFRSVLSAGLATAL